MSTVHQIVHHISEPDDHRNRMTDKIRAQHGDAPVEVTVHGRKRVHRHFLIAEENQR
ncbi:hypothetical protein ACIQYZ_13525 [Rhodococcus erythropolis]